jgi:hypothetical protein
MVEPNGAVHPLAARFPLLPEEGLQQLTADIAANGLRRAITLDAQGLLLDGRNRTEACNRAGVAPHFEVYDGDPVAFILSANVHRRHLTQGARAMAFVLAGTKYTPGADSELNHKFYTHAGVVALYAPELVDAVLAGGSLEQAYGLAAARQAEKEAERRALRALRRTYPDLAAHVDSGAWSLPQAVAARDALERAAALGVLRDAVVLAREEIGAPVPIGPAPDLTVTVSPPATAHLPDLNADALREERYVLGRLALVKRELAQLLARPLVEATFWPEAQVPAIRSAVSQIVASAYALAERYNRELGDQPRIRSIG